MSVRLRRRKKRGREAFDPNGIGLYTIDLSFDLKGPNIYFQTVFKDWMWLKELIIKKALLDTVL